MPVRTETNGLVNLWDRPLSMKWFYMRLRVHGYHWCCCAFPLSGATGCRIRCVTKNRGSEEKLPQGTAAVKTLTQAAHLPPVMQQE